MRDLPDGLSAAEARGAGEEVTRAAGGDKISEGVNY
jgi:hypothetical protein